MKSQFVRTYKYYWKEKPYCCFYPLQDTGPIWERRVELRRTLVQELERFVSLGKSREELLKPGQRPQSSVANISISHCKTWVGFIFSLKLDVCVGLDIEQAERIQPKLMGRVSQEKELKEAPQAALLWVAKESAFKCLPQQKTSLVILSDVFISSWKLLNPNSYSFCFRAMDYEGEGVAFLDGELAVASTQMRVSLKSQL